MEGVHCQHCNSIDVYKTASYAKTVLTIYIISGLTFVIGIFLWPLIFLSGLLFIIATVMGTMGLVTKISAKKNPKSKEEWEKANWQWRCRECRKIFSYIPGK